MNKISSIISVVCLFLVGGCTDFLEEDTRAIITTSNFYNNELEAKQAVNGIYATIRDYKITGPGTRHITTDLTKRASWDEGSGLANYNFTAENSYIQDMWVKHYSGIKDCNSVIDNITANQEHIDNWERYVAEARGIRAFLYFDLVRWFGDVPLVLKEVRSLNDLEIPRTPVRDVFKAIIEDLEYCEEYSMEKGDTECGYQYGRFTKDAARGFLAKVYLWLGSVAQRDNKDVYGTASENFETALKYAEAVIKGGRFKLVDYYPDVFDAKTRDKAQEEVLWCMQGATGDGTGAYTGMMFGIGGAVAFGGSWGNVGSSDYHRMIYEPSDSIRRLWNCPRMEILDDGQLYGWDYEKYWDTKPGSELTGQDPNKHSRNWCIGKFRRYPVADLATYNYNNFGMDEPLLRYADILLIYAEAFNEVNDGPGVYTPSSSLDLTGLTVASAYDAVNVVRKRARIANKGIIHEDPLPRELNTTYQNNVDDCVPDWKPGSYGCNYDGSPMWDFREYTNDYDAFREEILYERARELVAETTDRWCDLVRRGKLVSQMQVWRVYNPFISQTERNIPTVGAPENVRPYHMLLPIPSTEMSVNRKLVQNPGY